jgi:hypothetical protein
MHTHTQENRNLTEASNVQGNGSASIAPQISVNQQSTRALMRFIKSSASVPSPATFTGATKSVVETTIKHRDEGNGYISNGAATAVENSLANEEQDSSVSAAEAKALSMISSAESYLLSRWHNFVTLTTSSYPHMDVLPSGKKVPVVIISAHTFEEKNRTKASIEGHNVNTELKISQHPTSSNIVAEEKGVPGGYGDGEGNSMGECNGEIKFLRDVQPSRKKNKRRKKLYISLYIKEPIGLLKV